MPGLLDTIELERQQRGEGDKYGDPPVLPGYVIGFLDGIAHARANASAHNSKSTSGLSVQDDSHTAPPLPADLGTPRLFPPSDTLASWSLDQSYTTSTWSTFQSPEVPSDHETLDAPSMDLQVSSSGTNGCSINDNFSEYDVFKSYATPPTADGDGVWTQASGGMTSMLVQETPVQEDVVPNQRYHVTGSILGEVQPTVSGLTENHAISHDGFDQNSDQHWYLSNWQTSLATRSGASDETGCLVDTGSRATGEATLKEQATLLKGYVARRPQPSKSSAPSRMTKRARDGTIQTTWRAYGSNRSKFTEESRKSTAVSRTIGACDACRKMKIRCNQSSEMFVPCGGCAKVLPRLLSQPCCRVELIDVKLFRLGDSPATLGQWLSSKLASKGELLLPDGTIAVEQPRRVFLTQDVNITSFAVTISRFRPAPHDTTSYVWKDAEGNKGEVVLPPYYINSNPIVRKTFQEAERYYAHSKSALVAAALMFWSATRMIERWWLICGTDLLGIQPMEHNMGPCRRNPFMDAIPVTPVMDTQLDELAIRGVLVPLKANLMRLLKEKVLAKKKEYWYEIYLASFIILHNSERVLEHMVDFSRRFGVSPDNRSSHESSLSQGYYQASKTLLAYFHFASGGAAPLSLDWDGPSKEDASIMTPAQIAYLRDIKKEVASQDSQLRVLKDKPMYGTELYWCHQMLFPGWKAEAKHAGTFLEFTEKDFLVT